LPPTHVTLRPGDFFGEVAYAHDAADLLLRETIHAPRLVIPRHEHESAHFCLGVTGACTERIHGRDLDCVPGTLEFHPAGTCHASRWREAEGRCFTVTLGTSWTARLAELEKELAPRSGVLGAAAGDLMARLRRELLQPDACSAMAVEGLTLTLISAAGRMSASSTSGPPSWLARAEDFLRAHAHHSVRVEDAARAAGVEPVLLSRWFRRVHGITTGEFVRRMRVERACELLSSSASLSVIALECGFADHAHFTRTFRRVMHMTPSAYRRVRGHASRAG
jgi:AraC family transcriptional regulator